MAKQFLGQRKQRTRQHVIADLSVHYVEGFILADPTAFAAKLQKAA
jgi:hypothetical protein